MLALGCVASHSEATCSLLNNPHTRRLVLIISALKRTGGSGVRTSLRLLLLKGCGDAFDARRLVTCGPSLTL
jgi:hypothetical protein